MDIFWMIASFILGVLAFVWIAELIFGLNDHIFDPVSTEKEGPLK